jgi:hypothetical protein
MIIFSNGKGYSERILLQLVSSGLPQVFYFAFFSFLLSKCIFPFCFQDSLNKIYMALVKILKDESISVPDENSTGKVTPEKLSSLIEYFRYLQYCAKIIGTS